MKLREDANIDRLNSRADYKKSTSLTRANGWTKGLVIPVSLF